MAIVKPFPALLPEPALAGQICELPYDVLSSAEARMAAAGNPLSFFHVSKAEIDLDPAIDPHHPRVYAQAAENFSRLMASGALRRDPQARFYLYRQVMGAHTQVGLVAITSCQEYLDNLIRKHELTRPDKEDDRVRHIESLDAQTGPAFLVYRADSQLNAWIRQQCAPAPEIDFTARDGVRHSAWIISDPATIKAIEGRFAALPALYIADGHHRSAAAARVFQSRQGRGGSGGFLSVLFPHDQVQILPYHRVLRDFNDLTPAEVLVRLEQVFIVTKAAGPKPLAAHEICFYRDGVWSSLRFRPELVASPDPLERLDVALLQKHVLGPIFGIDNPRTSDRIHFVGGIRGTKELERLVNGRQFACAFAMFPTGIEELLAVAEGGGLMPPKSTWFEPKLRDGMFSHLLD